MTTALDLITDAMLEIGAHDAGQALPATDAALGLRYLNRLCQLWSNSPAAVPVLAEVSVPCTGAASYTIGPSGADVTANRPIRIERATVVTTTEEYPVRVLTREQWDEIAVKDVAGSPPSDVWYQASNTTGRLYVFPKASSGYTLKLECLSLLTSFSGLTTALTLPEGYETLIVTSLAMELAGPYQRPVSDELRRRAAGAMRVIKRTNSEVLLSEPVMATAHSYIERGY